MEYNQKIKRDISIDILRAIGLLLIVLVHVNPPFVISQLRCFDVPLMIFVSGLTTAGKPIDDYRKYVFKRTLRLMVPTYLFLTVYMILLFFAQSLMSKSGIVTWKIVYESYLMIGGIGYLWIIRIFLLIMLVTPLLYKLNEFINRDFWFVGLIILGVTLTTIVVSATNFLCAPNIVKDIVNDWVSCITGYSTIFLLGIRMRFADKQKRRFYITFVIVFALCGLIIYLVRHGFPITLSPTYKYPPQSYYLIYGLLLSSLLWSIKKYLIKLFNNKIFLFIGQNTIWIYLYHIPLLSVVFLISNNWLAKYVIVFLISTSFTYIQHQFAQKYMAKLSICKYLIG